MASVHLLAHQVLLLAFAGRALRSVTRDDVFNSPDYSAVNSSYSDSHRERNLALAQWFTVLSGTSTRTAWSLKWKEITRYHDGILLGVLAFSILIVERLNILRSEAQSNAI